MKLTRNLVADILKDHLRLASDGEVSEASIAYMRGYLDCALAAEVITLLEKEAAYLAMSKIPMPIHLKKWWNFWQ